jgi:hypothetical protein
METFEQWWLRTGKRNNPDQEDGCRNGWHAAFAQSGNYVADEETSPEKITFANGRIVRLVYSPGPSLHVE